MHAELWFLHCMESKCTTRRQLADPLGAHTAAPARAARVSQERSGAVAQHTGRHGAGVRGCWHGRLWPYRPSSCLSPPCHLYQVISQIKGSWGSSTMSTPQKHDGTRRLIFFKRASTSLARTQSDDQSWLPRGWATCLPSWCRQCAQEARGWVRFIRERRSGSAAPSCPPRR